VTMAPKRNDTSYRRVRPGARHHPRQFYLISRHSVWSQGPASSIVHASVVSMVILPNITPLGLVIIASAKRYNLTDRGLIENKHSTDVESTMNRKLDVGE